VPAQIRFHPTLARQPLRPGDSFVFTPCFERSRIAIATAACRNAEKSRRYLSRENWLATQSSANPSRPWNPCEQGNLQGIFETSQQVGLWLPANHATNQSLMMKFPNALIRVFLPQIRDFVSGESGNL
jgi:hypothetical protein